MSINVCMKVSVKDCSGIVAECIDYKVTHFLITPEHGTDPALKRTE